MRSLRRIFGKKQDLFLIFTGVIGIVMVWRGIWGLMDHFLFPNHPEASYIVSIVIGFFILLIDDYELEELGTHRGHDHGNDKKKTKEKKGLTTTL